MRSLAFLICAGLPALADCPPGADRSAEVDALYAAIGRAGNQMATQGPVGELWEIWLTAPDALAQELLDKGLAAHRVGDALGAIDAFSRLVEYCPDYAEGYNQRAFVAFRTGQFEAAREDLLAAADLSPRHTGILTGLALTLIAMGRVEEAQPWLRRAVALNPWLSERALLTEPMGQEL